MSDYVVTALERRAKIRQEYPKEFALHRAAAELLEAAVAIPRPMSSVVHTALDILMVQAYKSHYGVRLMAENGQAEDAATLTRRILELGVQAAFIGSDSDTQICASRAGQYLAHLWRSAPPELKQHVPESAVQKWAAIDQSYGPSLPKRGWAPTFKEMFKAIGRADTYEEDYRYLSAIAHGSTEEAILHYSLPMVPVRSHRHIPILLWYSTRYYLALAHVWENWFQVVDQHRYTREVEPLLKELEKPEPRPAG